MAKVTKKDLVKEIVERTGCKKMMAKQGVDSFFGALCESLMEGRRIEIRGFGAWTVRCKKPNPHARNPKTGESIVVPARRRVLFKPGKVLQAALKERVEE